MKIGIFGYGNLGKGVEAAVRQNPDMELAAIFTRRSPDTVKPRMAGIPVISASRLAEYKGNLDLLILCGGSATDLPKMTPVLAKDFNVLDSFDTHAKISEHFHKVDEAAKNSGHIAMICCGWDPGLFSLNRLYAASVLPDGQEDTFWGTGVSQGHSDAIRRIEGVADARQYTVPVAEAMEIACQGEHPPFTARQKHTRVCYVAAKPGADLKRIEETIKTMPDYFADYDTVVHFITQEEMNEKHSGLPHGGRVIRNGKAGMNGEHRCFVEYRLQLDSNPEFTGLVLIAYARALGRMYARGMTGCKTVFDVAPVDLSFLSPAELLQKML